MLRPGREDPYLCIQDVIIFVRDLEASLQLYVDQLGFELIADRRRPPGDADHGALQQGRDEQAFRCCSSGVGLWRVFDVDGWSAVGAVADQ